MKAEKKLLIYLEYLHERLEVDSYDTELQERVECGQKQILRDMRSLADNFDNIVETKDGRKIIHKLVRPIDIYKKAYDKSSFGLRMLFEAAESNMPELLEDIKHLKNADAKPYLFYNTPFEDISRFDKSPIFLSLKNAIERREYRTLYLKGISKPLHDIKPVKLLFSEGNWYLAYVQGDSKLEFSRISFIENVKYARSETYQSQSISPYLDWLKRSFQNTFSLYGVKPSRALLRAHPPIARYFDKGMKKFYRTQTFVGKDPDGSIRLEIQYTQELEILPFVQKWMPDLEILSPDSLKQAYIEKLSKALNRS